MIKYLEYWIWRFKQHLLHNKYKDYVYMEKSQAYDMMLRQNQHAIRSIRKIILR